MGSWDKAKSALVSWLDGNGSIEEVDRGVSNEVDISTHTNFPLAFVVYGDSANAANLSTYSFQVLFVSTVPDPAEQDDIDTVLDQMSEVKNQCYKAYYEGSLFGDQFRVSNNTSPLIYRDRQNLIYGWIMELSVTTPTNLDNCG